MPALVIDFITCDRPNNINECLPTHYCHENNVSAAKFKTSVRRQTIVVLYEMVGRCKGVD